MTAPNTPALTATEIGRIALVESLAMAVPLLLAELEQLGATDPEERDRRIAAWSSVDAAWEIAAGGDAMLVSQSRGMTPGQHTAACTRWWTEHGPDPDRARGAGDCDCARGSRRRAVAGHALAGELMTRLLPRMWCAAVLAVIVGLAAGITGSERTPATVGAATRWHHQQIATTAALCALLLLQLTTTLLTTPRRRLAARPRAAQPEVGRRSRRGGRHHRRPAQPGRGRCAPRARPGRAPLSSRDVRGGDGARVPGSSPTVATTH